MKLIGKIVEHKQFGKGKIVGFSENHIEVDFDKGEKNKKFVYPDSFGMFLEIKNESLAKKISVEKKEHMQKKMDMKKIKKEATRLKAIIRSNEKQAKSATGVNAGKSNIAFKCNFCDGGKSDETVGFNGVCSDEMIKYNIEKAKHIWCSGTESKCKKYINGEMTREELDVECNTDECVCYESQMLRVWRAYAGIVQIGKKKGTPMTLKNVRSNSLALLTTRLTNAYDKELFIFAAFLVKDNYEGNGMEEGYVEADEKYRIQLSIEEAKVLKFWDYYFNPNKPERTVFGSGLHRYLTDLQAAQILSRISQIKSGTKEEKLSKEFYEYYCTIKGLNSDEIDEPNGALRRIERKI